MRARAIGATIQWGLYGFIHQTAGQTVKNILSFIAILIIAWSLPTTSAMAEKRIALVIGNDAYQNLLPAQQLQKARNDAASMGNALEKIGFTVVRAMDASRRQFNLKLLELSRQIEPGDTVAFFYAGHGVRIDGANHLLPSDIPKIASGQEELLVSESINSAHILDRLRRKGAKVTLLILDACRNNPFQDDRGRSIGGTRGLTRMDPPEGSFVIFSAGTNQAALDRLSNDDDNPNSVFTRALLPYITQPGLEISQLAKKVRRDVRNLALSARGHHQTPAVYNEMIEDFYLVTSAESAPSRPARPVSNSNQQIELAYWDTVKTGTNPALFKAYLGKYPNGLFADLAKIKLAALARNQPSSTSPVQATPPKSREQATVPSAIIPKIAILPVGEARDTNKGDVKETPPVKKEVEIVSLDQKDPPIEPATRVEPDIDSSDEKVIDSFVTPGLIRDIQKHLNRLGCDVGRADGVWGRKSRNALRQANIHLGMHYASLEPSQLIFNRLKSEQRQLCEPSCSARQVLRNGRCIAKSCPSGQRLSQSGNCYTSNRQASNCRPGYRKNSWGECYKARTGKKRRIRRTAPKRRTGNCFIFNGKRVCE